MWSFQRDRKRAVTSDVVRGMARNRRTQKPISLIAWGKKLKESWAKPESAANHPLLMRFDGRWQRVRPYDVRADCRITVVIQRDLLRLEKLKVHPPVRPETPACLQVSNVGDTQKSLISDMTSINASCTQRTLDPFNGGCELVLLVSIDSLDKNGPKWKPT